MSMLGIFKRNFHFVREEIVKVKDETMCKIVDEWRPNLGTTDPQTAPEWITETNTYKAAMSESPAPIIPLGVIGGSADKEPEPAPVKPEKAKNPQPAGFIPSSFGAAFAGDNAGLKSK